MRELGDWRLDEDPDSGEDALTFDWLMLEPDPNALWVASPSVLVTVSSPASDAELCELGDNDVEVSGETIAIAPPERSRIPIERQPPTPRATKVGAWIQRRSGRKYAVAYWRRHKVVEMRIAGIPFKDIAQQLGFNSIEGARYAYYRALEDTKEASEDLRLLELERLDQLTQIVWPQIKLGDLEAINTYLKISAVRARVAGFERAPLVNPGNKIVIEGTPEDEHTIAMIQNVEEFLALLPGLAAQLSTPASAAKMIEGATAEHVRGNGSTASPS